MNGYESFLYPFTRESLIAPPTFSNYRARARAPARFEREQEQEQEHENASNGELWLNSRDE